MAIIASKKRTRNVIYSGDVDDLDAVQEQTYPQFISEMASRHELEDANDSGAMFEMVLKGDPFPEDLINSKLEAENREDIPEVVETYRKCYEEMEEAVKVSNQIDEAMKNRKEEERKNKKAKKEKEAAERAAAKVAAEKAVKEATKITQEAHSNALTTVAKSTGKGGLLSDPLSLLPEGFNIQLTSGKVKIPKDADKATLLQAITAAAAIREGVTKVGDQLYWLVGDAILAYRNNFDSSWEKAITATGVEETLGLSFATIRRMPYVCERFPNSKRLKGLTWTHYAEAYCALPEDEEAATKLQEDIMGVLKTAQAGKKVGNVTKPLAAQAFVREEVRKLRDAAMGKRPVPNTIDAIIIGVNIDEETGAATPTVHYCDKPLTSSQVLTLVRADHIIIDRKKKLQFVDMDGPHDINWIDPKTIDTKEVDKELEEQKAKEEEKKEKKAGKKAPAKKSKKPEPEPEPEEEEEVEVEEEFEDEEELEEVIGEEEVEVEDDEDWDEDDD